MSEALRTRPANRTLAWSTAVAVGSLALGGFVLSFQSLRELAVRSGLDQDLAFIWPLIVDGFIVVATASAFALKHRGVKVSWYPWSALILFSAISVTGNAMHAMDNTAISIPPWIATTVSSVPAIALLIASHLLVVIVGANSHRSEKRQAAPKPAAAEGRAQPSPSVSSSGDVEVKPRKSAQKTDLVSQLEEIHADGGQITGNLIARLEAVSERTGRRRLNELREVRPDLFARKTSPARAEA